ncbi:MAG: SPFH domain-containing protein, partial [Anaerolineales bacterium]|nr:SPFH domain-containing protein [Anaerolineales bacterium]
QPFVFSETTSDQQPVSVQGGFVYRVSDPKAACGHYDFTVDPMTGQAMGDGVEKLTEFLTQSMQSAARSTIQSNPLEGVIAMHDSLADTIYDRVGSSDHIGTMGVTVDTVYVSALTPDPEIRQALEAPYREGLLQQADEAVYARRALAVEQERAIKDNELTTQIGLEERRAELVQLEGDNTLREADFRAQAATKELAAYDSLDAATLTAYALVQIGQGDGRIGSLNITNELLGGLLNMNRG